MKILFMGSAEFAIPSLSRLVESEHEVISVITQPDKPAGRGREIKACPVALKAREDKLPLYQPKSLKSKKVLSKLESMAPDIIVVVAYGKLLPNDLLNIPKKWTINIHPSLLPAYRGAAPINWTIIKGEETTGITTMFISDKLDAGDILLQQSVSIDNKDTAITLSKKLSDIGADLLIKTIDGLIKNSITPTKQDDKKATFAPLLKKEDGYIDWSRNAEEIRNLIRGLQPWPSAYTFLDNRVLKIYSAAIVESKEHEAPGKIIECGKKLIIKTGNKALSINELQIEGKKKMNVKDFLNGYKLNVGTILE